MSVYIQDARTNKDNNNLLWPKIQTIEKIKQQVETLYLERMFRRPHAACEISDTDQRQGDEQTAQT